MVAVVAGYSRDTGYVFKCPVCGTILADQEWRCPNCDQVIEQYSMSLFSHIKYPKVCVDLHGVVLDMLGALSLYLKEKHGVVLDPASVTDYDFNCDLGFDNKLVFQAFKDVELHRRIGLYEKADIAIEMLRQRAIAQAYTGVINDSAIIVTTNGRIRELGLEGRAVTYKKPIIYDAVVLFDDCTGVHRQWANGGFKGLQYIIDRPYNQPSTYDPLWDKLIRVDSLYSGVVDMYRRFGWPLPEVRLNE